MVHIKEAQCFDPSPNSLISLQMLLGSLYVVNPKPLELWDLDLP